jgi:predicted O-methyltransferase YrrM
VHAGAGLLHWQYPNQFSKYLVELTRHRIESYLEIGVRHGGTFVITLEYLRRFHPVQRAVGADLATSATLRAYASSSPGTTVLEADSHGAEFEAFVEAQGPFDLVLIDGDHSEGGCRRDFEMVRDLGRIIVFHDIVSEPVPGVGRVWREVKESYADRFDFVEFVDQYLELRQQVGVDYLGIGMAVSRQGQRPPR